MADDDDEVSVSEMTSHLSSSSTATWSASRLIYLRNHIHDIIHAPLSTLLKSSLILNDSIYQDVLPIAWDMLLQPNTHVTTTAGNRFKCC